VGAHFFVLTCVDGSKQHKPVSCSVMDIPTAFAFFGMDAAKTCARVTAAVTNLVRRWNAVEASKTSVKFFFPQTHCFQSMRRRFTFSPPFFLQWESRNHYSHYEVLSSHQVEKFERDQDQQQKRKSAKKKAPVELITSQLVLNISNWGFVRDLTQAKTNKFVPCSVLDVNVAFKLSSTVFKSQRQGGEPSDFHFDRNGAVLPFAAFISLIKDVKFTSDFMTCMKEKYEKEQGKRIVSGFAARNQPDEEEGAAAAAAENVRLPCPTTARQNLASLFEELRDLSPVPTNRDQSLQQQQQQQQQQLSEYNQPLASTSYFNQPPPPPPPPSDYWNSQHQQHYFYSGQPVYAQSHQANALSHPPAPQRAAPAAGSAGTAIQEPANKPRTKRAAALVASLSISQTSRDQMDNPGDEIKAKKKKGSQVRLPPTPEDDEGRSNNDLSCTEKLFERDEDEEAEEEDDDDDDDDDEAQSRRFGRPRRQDQTAEASPRSTGSKLDRELMAIASSVDSTEAFCDGILAIDGESGNSTPRGQVGSNYSGSQIIPGQTKKSGRGPKKH